MPGSQVPAPKTPPGLGCMSSSASSSTVPGPRTPPLAEPSRRRPLAVVPAPCTPPRSRVGKHASATTWPKHIIDALMNALNNLNGADWVDIRDLCEFVPELDHFSVEEIHEYMCTRLTAKIEVNKFRVRAIRKRGKWY